jgi:hypothetical protein
VAARSGEWDRNQGTEQRIISRNDTAEELAESRWPPGAVSTLNH